MENGNRDRQQKEQASEEERRRRQLEAVNEAALAITTELSIDKVLQKIVDVARDLVDAQYAALGVAREDLRGLERFIVSGISQSEIEAIGAWPRGLGLLGLLLREPRPVRVAEISGHSASVGFPPNHPPMKSFLGVPIISKRKILGNFYLTNKTTAAEFSEEDERTIVLFAAHAAVAIENARLYTETDIKLREKILEVEEAERRARFLVELSSLLPSAPTTVEFQALAVAERLTEMLGDACSVILVDPEKPNTILSRVTFHRDPARAQAVDTLVDEAWDQIVGHVVERTGNIFVPDTRRSAASQAGLDYRRLTRFRFSAALAIPITTPRAVYGILVSAASVPLTFADEHLTFANLVAERVGVAIENVRLYKQIRQQASLLQGMIDHAPVHIAFIDQNLRFQWSNPTYARLLGHNQQDIVGQEVTEIAPGMGHTLIGRLRQTLEQGEPYVAQDFPLRPDKGSEVYWNLSFTPVRDAAGYVQGVLFVAVDVTQEVKSRAEIEDLARVAQARFAELETLLDTMAEAVYVADNNGTLIRVNAAYARLIGATSKADAARSLREYAMRLNPRKENGDPYPYDELPMSRSLNGETYTNQILVITPLGGGHDRYLSVSGAPIRDLNGRIVAGVNVARDVTELKELERLKDEFISSASHELKTPLASARGWAQILMRKLEQQPGREDELKEAETIVRQMDHLNELVERLLDVSRIQVGRLELEKEQFDLVGLLRDVVAKMQVMSEKHQLRPSGDEAVTINADPGRIEQVMVNLVSNGIKYSPEGGPVELSVSTREGKALVSVRDFGLGIPREKQPHIFGRFYRAGTGKGLGLGLYITKGIVEAHHGRIWFESEEGKGSTFYVELPVN